jgi:hypothetical protein
VNLLEHLGVQVNLAAEMCARMTLRRFPGEAARWARAWDALYGLWMDELEDRAAAASSGTQDPAPRSGDAR